MANYDPIYGGWFSTTANSTATVWTVWNTTATTVSTSGTPWTYWTTNETVNANVTWTTWNAAPLKPQTPEEIAAAADRARVARAEWEERQARERVDREQAVQRAETLLHANLNVRQRRALKARGAFRVKSQSGRWYEVGRGHHGNLTELGRRGKPVNRLCVYATGGVPEGDSMLAQKLWLEANEEQLRKVAYITPVAA